MKWTDEIVYITAKTERLTATGINKISDPIDSLDAVRELIAYALSQTNDLGAGASYAHAVRQLADRRVLLCLDNLETLLLDHPETVEDFVADLPPSWRVLVTSRIPLNSANVLTIEPMSDRRHPFLRFSDNQNSRW